jgi:hypothetical protein
VSTSAKGFGSMRARASARRKTAATSRARPVVTLSGRRTLQPGGGLHGIDRQVLAAEILSTVTLTPFFLQATETVPAGLSAANWVSGNQKAPSTTSMRSRRSSTPTNRTTRRKGKG